MTAPRWHTGTAPGARSLPIRTRIKRWVVELATRDQRIRRMALNRIFSDYAAEGILALIPFGDHKVFVDPRDDRIAYTLLTGRPWQRKQLDAAFDGARTANRLAHGGVFLDVGANIGLMTIYAILSGHFSKAIAIEPDAWNREILRQNLEINGLTERVTVIAAAASSASGTMTLHRDRKNLGAHSLEPGFAMSPAQDVQTVPVERLDAMITAAAFAPSDLGFVKIDVEGHEFAALDGMPDIIDAHPPLMIEVTFDATGRTSQWRRLVELLSPGYTACTDLNAGPAAAPLALSDFRPSAPQHELLFF